MSEKTDHFRKEAKRLKKSFATGDKASVLRVKSVLSNTESPKHADFLHVIAVENGHESWPKLKFALEALSMNRDQRAERLKAALYWGQKWVVNKLLSEDPALPDHNLGLQIATYNLPAVHQALNQTNKATDIIGVRSPILHLAFSKYIHMAPEKENDMLAIAGLLLQNGADPNDGYPHDPGSDHKLSALYGALCHADNIKLGAWLLENGATPDDEESLYHSTELNHTEALKLLIKHNARTTKTNALLRALDFDDHAKISLLLEHGADPDELVPVEHPSGEPVPSIPALHHAARRFCSGKTAELLVQYKANTSAIWQSHSPYAIANIYGNFEFADSLKKLGAATELSDIEYALTDCAKGKTPQIQLTADQLSPETQVILSRIAAAPARLHHIKALVTAGLDPDRGDDMNLPPLQIAAWEGLPDYVEYFLTLNPDLQHINSFGGNAIGTTIHGAEHCPHPNRNHIECARLLLKAGATITQEQIEHSGSESMTAFLDEWLEQDN